MPSRSAKAAIKISFNEHIRSPCRSPESTSEHAAWQRRASFEEHIRPLPSDGHCRPMAAAVQLESGLAEVLEALQKGFIQISHLLRHGLRAELPAEEDPLLDRELAGLTPDEASIWRLMREEDTAHSRPGFTTATGLHGRTHRTEAAIRTPRGDDDASQREVLMHDQRVANILLEALRRTKRVCAVALETHEGARSSGSFLTLTLTLKH